MEQEEREDFVKTLSDRMRGQRGGEVEYMARSILEGLELWDSRKRAEKGWAMKENKA